jgi:hypothetical protein
MPSFGWGLLRILPVLFFFFFTRPADAQVDYGWWVEKHNWDGYTHWTKYMRLSPAFMGPNALPVPGHTAASIAERPSATFGISGYYSEGDKTLSNNLRLSFPIMQRVQIDIYGTSLEYFQNDTLTRDQRVVRYTNSKGYAWGDVYFSTNVLLWQQKERIPAVSFRFAFKTASGGSLDYARFTDAPAYHIDLTAARAFSFAKSKRKIRVFAMAGFYAWQTYDPLHPQNDAFLYGVGGKINLLKHLECEADWSGYYGYLNNGDRPMLVRFKLILPFRNIQLHVSQTIGLNDYPYYGLDSGILFSFGGSTNSKKSQ